MLFVPRLLFPSRKNPQEHVDKYAAAKPQ